jgi:hypothetical protein
MADAVMDAPVEQALTDAQELARVLGRIRNYRKCMEQAIALECRAAVTPLPEVRSARLFVSYEWPANSPMRVAFVVTPGRVAVLEQAQALRAQAQLWLDGVPDHYKVGR